MLSSSAGENNNAIVTLAGVELAFEPEREVLSGINLTIERGSVTVIMGPSGCGKSTLLNLIGGRLLPDRGQVLVDGESVPELSRSELFALRRRMGMMFQSGALLTDLSAFENVAFPLREHTDLSEPLIRNIVLMKLEMVGLRGARDLMPSELSGGMARRVAFARTIALDPELILYDEPFTGLDPISMGVTAILIRDLNDALGATSVVVTHDVPQGCSIADYGYLIGEGKVIEQGMPEALYQTKSEEVRQFMEGLPDGPVPFHYPASGIRNDFLGGGVR